MIKTFNTQNWRHVTDFICGTPVYQVNFPLLKGTIYYVLRLYAEGGDGTNKLYFEHELNMRVIYSESFTPIILAESLTTLLPKFFPVGLKELPKNVPWRGERCICSCYALTPFRHAAKNVAPNCWLLTVWYTGRTQLRCHQNSWNHSIKFSALKIRLTFYAKPSWNS